MNQELLEAGLNSKDVAFSLASEATEGQMQVIVLPVPAEARPVGVVHVGGIGSGTAC